MKKYVQPTLFRAFVWVIAGTSSFLLPSRAAGQVDEAKIEEQLNQVAIMMGLGPVEPAELKSRVQTIGGLSFQDDVPIDFMSREALSDYLGELFAEEYPPEEAEREERALRAFGFLERDDDLRAIRERVLYENIAGFYDERPGIKKLFAISSNRSLTLMNQLVLSHELRHAVQDQHVVIRDQLAEESDFDDRRLAALCLFEGDAVVLMQQYLSSGNTDSPAAASLSRAFAQALSGPEVANMFAGSALAEAPAIVQEQLVAPYFRGGGLAQAAFDRGGFELLNRLLSDPPRSTEQVLHPEKYLDEPTDEPIPVDVPEAEGKDVIFSGRLGELFIRTLLADGPAAAVSEPAAAGWGGDAYALLAGENGDRLVWRSVWDRESDAEEFAGALSRHMAQRFGDGAFALERDGRNVRFEREAIR